ncbi:hypothetical protein [Klebsiella pneumoniae]|uniref:hypothetical protein n=1 Tax=Klebsiella pneumoniae TaxID=573 RepID=UPI003D3662C4
MEDADEVVEETEDTSVSSLKDSAIASENDIEEQEFADAVGDDGLFKNSTKPFLKLNSKSFLDDDIEDDDDDSEEDELEEKPTTYAGLSLLGLRNYFSRFFQ